MKIQISESPNRSNFLPFVIASECNERKQSKKIKNGLLRAVALAMTGMVDCHDLALIPNPSFLLTFPLILVIPRRLRFYLASYRLCFCLLVLLAI